MDDRQKEFEEFIKLASKDQLRELIAGMIDQENLLRISQLIDKIYGKPT